MRIRTFFRSVMLVMVLSLCTWASAANVANSVSPVATVVADGDDASRIYKAERRYLFGVAIGLSDSITYVTDVCPIDGMDFDSRFKSPLGLELYTANFREFLSNMGRSGYLCSTFYAKTLREAVNKLVKVRKKILKAKNTMMVELTEYQYHYIPTHQIRLEPAKSEEEDF